jgi:hypothetical protein
MAALTKTKFYRIPSLGIKMFGGPSTPNVAITDANDIWIDTTNFALKIYNGSSWVLGDVSYSDISANTLALSGTLTSSKHAISFSGLTCPAGAGNYGQVLDCSWVDVDPGSGGSFGAKLMFSNTDTSGYVLYGLGLRCRSAAASAKVVGFNVSASAAVASSGQVIGGQFYLQNSGSYTIVGGGGYPSTALYCKSWLAAACDKASALWIDDESSTKATTQYMVDITMNGSALIDDVFHIYGGDPGATNLFNFDTCNQGAGAFCVPGATVAGTPSVKLKCKFGSTTFYLQGYDS